RAPRARENGKHLIPRRVDLGPTRGFDRYPQQLTLPRQQLAVAVTAEPLEQPRRALDVREQERHRSLRQRPRASHALDHSPKVCGFSYGASTSRTNPHWSDLLS